MSEFNRKLSRATADVLAEFAKQHQKHDIPQFQSAALPGFAAPTAYSAPAHAPAPPASSSAASGAPHATANAPSAPAVSSTAAMPPAPPAPTGTSPARATTPAAPREQVHEALALHARLSKLAVARGWGEDGAALVTLVEPRDQDQDGNWQLEAFPTDDEFSEAMGVGLNQVVGKLRLVELVAHAPVAFHDDDEVAAYAMQLATLRDELTAELAEFLGDNPGMSAQERVFPLLAAALYAVLDQRIALQRVCAKTGGPTVQELMMMEDCCGAMIYNEEQWEATEAQYALLNEFLRSDASVEQKESAAGGPGGTKLVRLLLVLLDSGDDRERECVGDLLAMAWEEGLFRDSLLQRLHEVLWSYVYDDRGKMWCCTPQYVYRVLQVLNSCLDEGNVSARQYQRLFDIMAPLHVPDNMPEYHAQLKRTVRLLVKLDVDTTAEDSDGVKGGEGVDPGNSMTLVANASRNARLARFVSALCTRWPSYGSAKQIGLLGEVEELMLTTAEWPMRGAAADRAQYFQALRPCFMPFARCLTSCLGSGLQLMSRSMEMLDQHTVALGQIMHEAIVADEDVLQHYVSSVDYLAKNHFSNDIKPQMADLLVRLLQLQKDRHGKISFRAGATTG